MNLGATEIILIVLALFLLFGASRLPQLAESLGRTREAFKDGMREAEEEEKAELEKRQFDGAGKAPQVTSVSDEELLDDLRRRAEAKQINSST